MSTQETPEKLKTAARRPRGLEDRTPASIRAAEAMMETIRRVYSLYGFEPVETPFLEYTDALGKFLPDQDRPNAGVFSLKDDDGQWMSLRYDLTAPLARYVAENWQNLPKPYRSYRAGYVFRNEKPGPGRFRQFMQFDADTVGAPSVAADAEICMMAADTLHKLGLHEPADENGYEKPLYVIKVNNRKVLDGVMEAIGLGGEENAGRRLTVLRAIDKLDKFSLEEIKKLLGAGRLDESGDFTKGANLSEDQITNLMGYILSSSALLQEGEHLAEWETKDSIYLETQTDGIIDRTPILNRNTVKKLKAYADIFNNNPKYIEGIEELEQITNILDASKIGSLRIRIDPSVVRGLEYYTGPVFEAELLFDTTDEEGKPVRFGSVGGGGRYDGLVSRFLDEPVPATGFSIGVSRLLAALQALGKVSTKPAPGPVVVLAMDKTPEAMASYQAIVADLRRANIPAELYLGSAGMKAQLKYANRRHSTIAVIQGGNERNAGTVKVKDLILGATLNSSKDRSEHIAQQAVAEVEVPVAEVVDIVRKVLTRQG